MAKVSVGFFSFTEVTDPAEHRSYNAWHQLDHMPEQYPLPGVVFGQRWVSTPACRAARAVDGALLAPIHYVTLYLMGEPLDETLREFRALGEELHAAGRFHEHRRSRLSGPFDVTAMAAAPRVLVSAEAVAFRPNLGVYVVVREPDAGAAAGDTGDTGDTGDGALLGVDGVAGVWTFAAGERFAGHRWRPGRRAVTVCYLDREPLGVAGALGERVVASSTVASPVVFAGPFETITPWHWDWFDQGG